MMQESGGTSSRNNDWKKILPEDYKTTIDVINKVVPTIQTNSPTRKELHVIVSIFKLWEHKDLNRAPRYFDSPTGDEEYLFKTIVGCLLQECKSEILEIWSVANKWWPNSYFKGLPLIVEPINKESEIKSGIISSYMQDNINQSDIDSKMKQFREKRTPTKQTELNNHEDKESQIEMKQKLYKLQEEYASKLAYSKLLNTLNTL